MKEYQGDNPYERRFREATGKASHGRAKKRIEKALATMGADQLIVRRFYGLDVDEAFGIRELAAYWRVTEEQMRRRLRRCKRQFREALCGRQTS